MTPSSSNRYRQTMRDIAEIDAELRLLAVVRDAARAEGGQPTTRRADELLDERNAVDRGVSSR